MIRSSANFPSRTRPSSTGIISRWRFNPDFQQRHTASKHPHTPRRRLHQMCGLQINPLAWFLSPQKCRRGVLQPLRHRALWTRTCLSTYHVRNTGTLRPTSVHTIQRYKKLTNLPGARHARSPQVLQRARTPRPRSHPLSQRFEGQPCANQKTENGQRARGQGRSCGGCVPSAATAALWRSSAAGLWADADFQAAAWAVEFWAFVLLYFWVDVGTSINWM